MLNNSQGVTPRRTGNSNHPPSSKKTNLYAAAAQNASSSDSLHSLIPRINHLFDNQNYEECALLVARTTSLAHCVGELPMTRAYNGIPHSLVFLGAVYSKISLSADSLIIELHPETFLRHVIKWLSSEPRPAAHKDSSVTPYVPSIRDILRIIVRVSPDLPQKLNQKKQKLHRGVLQLGHHGLVDSSDFKMMNLHEALRLEFKKRLQQFKAALQKLEELSSCQSKTTRTPSDGSHQRMMQISLAELEERLIKNKSSLTTVEVAVANSHVDYLVNVLEERVDSDKQMLFQLMELRREFGEENIPSNAVVARTLQRHISGHEQVLSIWREVLPLQFAEVSVDETDGNLRASRGGRMTFPVH